VSASAPVYSCPVGRLVQLELAEKRGLCLTLPTYRCTEVPAGLLESSQLTTALALKHFERFLLDSLQAALVPPTKAAARLPAADDLQFERTLSRKPAVQKCLRVSWRALSSRPRWR
jgi:hypothetical protein